MDIPYLTRSFIYFLCIVSHIALFSQQAPIPPAPALSQDDQKMLAQLDKEIDAFVSSLSPAEQEEFWDQTKKLQEVMSQMEPKELDDFIQGVFSGEITDLPIAPPTPKPTAPKTPTPKPATPKTPTPAPVAPVIPQQQATESAETKDAIETLDSIIDQIETFFRKAQIIPEFETKVQQWAEDKQIRAWEKGARWNKTKLQITDFVQKLYKIKDRDAKTKAYKYIDKLIANKALVNNLKQLMTVLKQQIPTIEAPEFGQTKLSKTTRTAIQETISILNESLSLVKIPAELEAIFEGYGSIAEQLQAEEQTAREAALKPGKPYRAPTKPTEKPSYDYDTGSNYGGYEDFYSPYTPPSYNQPYSTYDRPTSESSYSPSASPSSLPSLKPGKGQAGEAKEGAKPSKDGAAAGGEKGKKPEDEKKSAATKDKSAAAKKEAAAAAAPDTIAEGYVDEALDFLERSVDALNEKSGALKGIAKHLTDGSPLSNEIALVSLPSAIRNVKKATDKIKTLTRRIDKTMKDNAQKKKYRTSLKADKQLKTLSTLAEDIKSIREAWNGIKQQVPPNKQYAYIGGMSADKADDAIKKAITDPSSIYDLEAAINKLLEAAKILEKGPAPKKMEHQKRKS